MSLPYASAISSSDTADVVDDDDDSSNDIEGDEEDMRKPAAKPRNEPDSRSADEPLNNESMEEDGRQLSEYERLRLERIKRNQEYLAQLGLEENKNKPPERKKRIKRESSSNEILERRASSRQVKPVSYAEPSISVRSILRTAQGMDKPSRESSERQELVERKPIKKYDPQHRMEGYIWTEFRRLKSHRKAILKQAERALKWAEKEKKYWSNRALLWERKNQRVMEAQQQRIDEERQRLQFGGKTTKELFHEMSRRMPIIQQAIDEYDRSLSATEQSYEKEVKRFEAEEKLKTLDAIDWFPKAMKSSFSFLDSFLLQSVPSDPPVPRRSTRSSLPSAEAESNYPKKKNAAAASGPSSSSNGNGLIGDSAYVPSPECESPELNNNKQRIRLVRNVGGWISPDFSKDVDRSWLEGNEPVEPFDVRYFVPQVGDTVLYYISGHMAYLDHYPDHLGSKTGSKRRIPLWTRAAQLQEQCKKGSDESSASERWWTEEWLHGVTDENLGDYPIICRVEQTHAEFPPDPFCKIVRTDQKSDSTTLYFKKPKAFQGICKTNVRLAVTLRPLTPLVAPTYRELESLETSSMQLPPTFTAVTFPCDLEPFIVPFAWCYTNSHELCTNLPVSVHSEVGSDVRIANFSPLWNRDTMLLDDRKNVIERLLSIGRNELEKLLVKERFVVPAQDTRIVLDRWYQIYEQFSSVRRQDSSDDTSVDRLALFFCLLRSTLPLWKSVTVMKKKNERSKRKISPWLLVTKQGQSTVKSPWTLGGSDEQFYLDEALRMKLECAVEDLVALDADIKDMFWHPVTEDCAPSYFCAVPVGMCFSTILSRVKVHTGHRTCYYRSADAMIADVRSILACCLLYNSPDSDVVHEADSIVTYAKDVLAKVAQDHYRTAKTSRSNQNDHRRLVLSHCQPRSWFVNHGKKAPKATLYRNWLDTTISGDHCKDLVVEETAPAGFTHAPFQAGDSVLYSRDLHRRFIDGHFASLQPEQCILPLLSAMGIESEGKTGDEDWVRGEVVWTHSSFPSLSESETARSFHSVAVLQTLFVKFQHSNDVCALFWRPCLFSFDIDTTGACCPGCGLISSFVRLSDHSELEEESVSKEVPVNSDQVRSIDRCITLLKRRCLRSVDPAFIDPLLTKENVKSGYKTPASKIVKSSLPTYDAIFCKDSELTEKPAVSTQHGTRGVKAKREKEDDVDVRLLVDCGFLPSWICGLSCPKRKDFARKFDFLVPAPKQCLEFILIKLQRGFYRHKVAIENDIVEAYVSSIVSLLRDKATRSISPISMKKLAQIILSDQDSSSNPDISKEEALLIKRIRCIRRLYVTALVSVIDCHRSERIFGLWTPAPPTRAPIINSERDQSRDLARQQLMYFVTVFGKDMCLNVFGKPENYVFGCLPRINVSVNYGVGHSSSASLVATVNSISVRVNIVCGGRTVVTKAIPVKQHDSDEVTNVSHSFGFDPEDYEKNEALSHLFFKRPGRANSCVRCQAQRRPMLSCRVLRRHSNPDFDWSPFSFGGISFVDDLIMVLSPAAAGLLDAPTVNSTDNGPIPQLTLQDEAHSKTSTDIVVCDEDSEEDPRPFAEQAAKAVSLASKLFAAAELFTEAPLRLSKMFIERFFPVDKSDGHYLYCVVCGLSGDLLCCDGCPNVVHRSCISLAVLPDGDWFCEECSGERTSLQSTDPRIRHDGTADCDRKSPADIPFVAADLNEPSSLCRYEFFGRTLFDESALDFLISQIDSLRAVRPTQRLKPTDVDEAVADNDDGVVVIRKEVTDDAESSFAPKKRGRPRKQSTVALPLVKPLVDVSSRLKRKKSSARQPNITSDEQHSSALTQTNSLSQLKTRRIGARITEVEINIPRGRRGLAIADTNKPVHVPILRSKSISGKRSFAARNSSVDLDFSLQVRQSKRNRFRTARLVDSL